MRTAVITDVHGNAAALEAVLAEVDGAGVDEVVCGGDLALFGPDPVACVDRLRSRDVPVVQGNTDRYLAEGRVEAHVTWTARLLGPERLAWLAGLPTRLPLPGHEAVLVHATPRSDEEVLLPDTPETDVAAMLAPERGRLVLGGHTHVQFARTVTGHRFANPGSVGLPFDGDRRAAWAVVEDGRVELRRTAYDVAVTIAAVEASDSPVRALASRRLRAAHA